MRLLKAFALILFALVLWPTLAGTANKVEVNQETTVVWDDTTTATDMDMNDLQTATGIAGDVHDWGASPRPYRYFYTLRIDFETATLPAAGEQVELYIETCGMAAAAADCTDNGATTVEVIAEIDNLKNLKLIGVLLIGEATPADGDEYVIEGFFTEYARHFNPVVWNATTGDFENVNDVNYVEITPIPDEIQ